MVFVIPAEAGIHVRQANADAGVGPPARRAAPAVPPAGARLARADTAVPAVAPASARGSTATTRGASARGGRPYSLNNSEPRTPRRLRPRGQDVTCIEVALSALPAARLRPPLPSFPPPPPTPVTPASDPPTPVTPASDPPTPVIPAEAGIHVRQVNADAGGGPPARRAASAVPPAGARLARADTAVPAVAPASARGSTATTRGASARGGRPYSLNNSEPRTPRRLRPRGQDVTCIEVALSALPNHPPPPA